MNTTTTPNESNESPSEPTACAGTCGGVYARGTEMVLLWQRHATAQGLVTRQDAFCFRCAIQDLATQLEQMKRDVAAAVPSKLAEYLPMVTLKQITPGPQVRWSESAETADATTSVAEVAS